MSNPCAALERVRAAVDAATVGPWYPVTDNCDCYGGCQHGENGTSEFAYAITTPDHAKWGFSDGSGDLCDPDDPCDYFHHQRSEISAFTIADIEFIALSRTAVPALVAALRAVLDKCDQEIQFAKGSASDYDHGAASSARGVVRVIADAMEGLSGD